MIDKKEIILSAAVSLSEERGYHSIQRDDVAKRAGCANGLVNRYFTTMYDLKEEVVKRGVDTDNLKIIAQACVNNHSLCKTVRSEVKVRAIEEAFK